MNKNTITKFLQSFVAIPMLAVASPLVGVTPTLSPAVVQSQNIATEASVVTTQEDETRQERAEKIDAFFESKDAPLSGYGMKFVTEAEKNDLDWRLLAAIAMRESTGGKEACKNPKAPNSVFGYGSCKFGFKSIDESIERVSASLGGNNENTAHHYGGKNTLQILRKYNSVIPNYPKEVVRIMKMIDDSEVI